ncbi:glycine betaine/L-proline ABC transporter substrate-binding protein ProX [Sulfurospirillum barnesii]|uniref:ABC-type proline/glycine betaine transport system, periplasmic component n=1 Tax=Sulfurospirillum barnesii (strain ATCC 700032 / DSM 10660 / SES-3) TaxID=760154 RepID=I3XTS3_SULBS|nr:glycine betaine/L-proline ABC transporter substrate-binding protein ProX [Sulfurospirillum barnesii]AFL67347.1 ABC-type proline/glycine betaine transport system, periplasmic component [Sulfurospirillum barnesii SES-3]
MNQKFKQILIGAMCFVALGGSSFANELPGKGIKVHPMQSSIAEERFQTVIINEALKALGYDVMPIDEVAYAVAYQTIAQNKSSKDIYFTAVNWTPLHDAMFEKVGGEKTMYRKGVFVEGCAQGYLIDKKTAQKYNIKYINDLKDPKIAKLFDSNGDGKADLAGCNPGWGCEKVIEHQLDAFGLRGNITHNQGEYSAIMAETMTRYKEGKPILYYTWTPYWVSGILVPNKDTVWLQVTHSAHPITKDTALANGQNYGFNVNAMKIVANGDVVKYNPTAAKLFEIAKLDINDISAQNMLINQGEKSEKAIENHAKAWIKAHQKIFDGWIEEAKKVSQ